MNMTIILTTKDLNRSIADIRADKAKPIDSVKQALQPAVKVAATVWLLDQGRLTCLKGKAKNPLILGAGMTALIDNIIDP